MIPIANFVTGAVTALFLAAVPLYVIELRRLAAKGESVEGRQLVAAILALLWLVLVYGTFIEPRLLSVRSYQVELGNGGRHLRAVVVSDIHLGLHKNQEWLKKVADRVNVQQPDVILLVGDFVSVDSGLEPLSALAGLKAPYGVYAVLGNWDYRVGAVDVRRRVESFSAEVLTNESVSVGPPEAPVYLVGLDDGIYGEPDWDRALAAVPAEATTVVLGHEPDFAPRAEVNGMDLVVSGHTHGGQVRLPGWGAVPPLPIGIPQDFDQGLFRWGRTQLFITPGVGESGARIRLFDPPEISVLEIDY